VHSEPGSWADITERAGIMNRANITDGADMMDRADVTDEGGGGKGWQGKESQGRQQYGF